MAKDIQEIVKKTFSFEDFNTQALDLFHCHYENNRVYHEYCQLLKVEKEKITNYLEIPFLPIEFFKSRTISANSNYLAETIFESSTTTSSVPSKHHIHDLKLYEQSILSHFEDCYGKVEQYNYLALLPNYLERGNSSLVYMANFLMKNAPEKKHDFYLNDFDQLKIDIQQLQANKERIFLLGVTYALLDFAELYPQTFSELDIVMETGGMKGRKAELTRSEVHTFLKKGFNTSTIHSEYGMTELLSQAYSSNGFSFFPPRWMKVVVHDPYDPLAKRNLVGKGIINVIDFANVYSCPFITTSDQGQLFEDGSFSVEGRIDNSSIRGCSLMYSNE